MTTREEDRLRELLAEGAMPPVRVPSARDVYAASQSARSPVRWLGLVAAAAAVVVLALALRQGGSPERGVPAAGTSTSPVVTMTDPASVTSLPGMDSVTALPTAGWTGTVSSVGGVVARVWVTRTGGATTYTLALLDQGVVRSLGAVTRDELGIGEALFVPADGGQVLLGVVNGVGRGPAVGADGNALEVFVNSGDYGFDNPTSAHVATAPVVDAAGTPDGTGLVLLTGATPESAVEDIAQVIGVSWMDGTSGVSHAALYGASRSSLVRALLHLDDGQTVTAWEGPSAMGLAGGHGGGTQPVSGRVRMSQEGIGGDAVTGEVVWGWVPAQAQVSATSSSAVDQLAVTTSDVVSGRKAFLVHLEGQKRWTGDLTVRVEAGADSVEREFSVDTWQLPTGALPPPAG